jgi:MFS family permease
MKRGHMGTLAIGVVILGYVLFAYLAGGIAGRSGSVAVTRARDPIIFWIALTLFAICGAIAFFYGLARTCNKATWFTTRIEAAIVRDKSLNDS